MTTRFAPPLLALLILAAAGPARADFVAMATLAGSNEVPPTGSTATGTITVTYQAAANDLLYTFSFSGLSTPATAAHLHLGAAGVAGPVILPFTNQGPPSTTSGTFSGTLTSADLINQATTGITTIAQAAAAIQAGDVYANIHSTNFPGGEIRGQLVVASVPEPAGLALLGLGAAGAILVRRRVAGRRPASPI